ncbi:hypothetical protein VTI74DRAFT_11004 [Chaetomium olivicolor]
MLLGILRALFSNHSRMIGLNATRYHQSTPSHIVPVHRAGAGQSRPGMARHRNRATVWESCHTLQEATPIWYDFDVARPRCPTIVSLTKNAGNPTSPGSRNDEHVGKSYRPNHQQLPLYACLGFGGVVSSWCWAAHWERLQHPRIMPVLSSLIVEDSTA